MTYSSIIVVLVKWLTRIGGVAFLALGVAAIVDGVWHGGFLGHLLIGTLAIAFGGICVSIRSTSVGGLEYGLLRRKR
jgi:hypothetical protein